MDIAIWSYNDFGKRTSESLKKYWRGEYSVTRIYDSEKAGRNDPFWNIEISDPTMIQTDYERGLFEKILVCINDTSALSGRSSRFYFFGRILPEYNGLGKRIPHIQLPGCHGRTRLSFELGMSLYF